MRGWRQRGRRRKTRIDVPMKDQLGKSIIFKGFRAKLTDQLGQEAATQVWQDANRHLAALRQKHPDLDRDSRMLLLPAAALYTALTAHVPQQALSLLTDYGTCMGQKIGSIVHGFTSIPGVPRLLWRNMPRLMRTMSSPKKGYSRRIVSESSTLVGVDILACPLHDAAVQIGVPDAARVICAMDKAYMTGFRHIRYTRTTSVAEGGECCDYRLTYDLDKR